MGNRLRSPVYVGDLKLSDGPMDKTLYVDDIPLTVSSNLNIENGEGLNSIIQNGGEEWTTALDIVKQYIDNGIVNEDSYEIVSNGYTITPCVKGERAFVLNGEGQAIAHGGGTLGQKNISFAPNAFAIGNGNFAAGRGSVALNISNAIIGTGSTGLGQFNVVKTAYSLVGGRNNTTENESDQVTSPLIFLFGDDNTIAKEGVKVLGTNMKAPVGYGVYLGKFNVGNASSVFEFGWGTADNDRKTLLSLNASGDEVVSGTVFSRQLRAGTPTDGAYPFNVNANGDIYATVGITNLKQATLKDAPTANSHAVRKIDLDNAINNAIITTINANY